MEFGKEVKERWFSVVHTVDFGLRRCVPLVCYRLTDDVRLTVEQMVKDDLARIYPEEVRFISGTAVPVKKPVRAVGKVEALPKASSEKPRGVGRGNRNRGNGGNGREFE